MYVRRCTGRLVLTTLLLLGCFSGAAAMAEGTVALSFRLDSPFFGDFGSAQRKLELEAAVADAVVTRAQTQFRFLQWQARPAAGASGPRLILKLIDAPGGICDPQPVVKLEWSAALDTVEKPLANMAQYDLYQACDPDIPAQDPDRLQRDVIAAAGKMLDNEASRQRINEQLLSKIPIASALINHEDTMLLLPVNAARLSADPESELSAEFKFAGGAAGPLPSRILLRPEQQFGNGVQLYILAIRVPSVSVSLPAQGGFWDEKLRDILAGSQDLRVYMVEYVPSPFAGETVAGSDVLSEL